MVDDSFELYLDMKTEKGYKEMAAYKENIEQVASRWIQIKQKIVKEGRNMMRSMYALVMLYKSVLKAFGQTLDPMQEVLLAYISTTVTTMLQISTALAATGLGAVAASVLLVAALVFNTMATAQALAGMAEAKEANQEAADVMERLGYLSSTLTWV